LKSQAGEIPTAAPGPRNPLLGRTPTRPVRCVRKNRRDYRYFPDPDLLLLAIPSWIDEIRRAAGSTGSASNASGPILTASYDAELLTSRKDVAEYFESTVKVHNNPKALANWIVGDLFRVLKERKLDEQLYVENWPVAAGQLGALVQLIDQGKINGKIAKGVFEAMLDGDKTPQQMLRKRAGTSVGLGQYRSRHRTSACD
jgi:aspartyl-tRNA(Asn)/glutamyl-tRNA(Gln) amidotransferase subunit B